MKLGVVYKKRRKTLGRLDGLQGMPSGGAQRVSDTHTQTQWHRGMCANCVTGGSSGVDGESFSSQSQGVSIGAYAAVAEEEWAKIRPYAQQRRRPYEGKCMQRCMTTGPAG